jgi:hypothetical protein
VIVDRIRRKGRRRRDMQTMGDADARDEERRTENKKMEFPRGER